MSILDVTMTPEEREALQSIRKARAAETNLKSLAENAIDALAKARQNDARRAGDEISFAKATASVLETQDGSELYSLVKMQPADVAAMDPAGRERLIAKLHSVISTGKV
jgi:hypothetical protein